MYNEILWKIEWQTVAKQDLDNQRQEPNDATCMQTIMFQFKDEVWHNASLHFLLTLFTV